jgi:hypothetical protein
MGGKGLQARIGEAGQGETEKQEQVFQFGPAFLAFLKKLLVRGVLGVFGKEKAPVENRFEALLQNRLVLFQRLQEFRGIEEGDFPSPVGGLKFPGGREGFREVGGDGGVVRGGVQIREASGLIRISGLFRSGHGLGFLSCSLSGALGRSGPSAGLFRKNASNFGAGRGSGGGRGRRSGGF